MRYFDSKALILMPDYETLMAKNEGYLVKLRCALNNLYAYCKSNFIELHGVYTDETLHYVDTEAKVRLFNLLSPVDTYFVYSHCEGMQRIASAERWDRLDLIEKTSKVVIDISDVERFKVIQKTEKKLVQLFAKEYKIVFNINFSSHTNYKVTSNPNDGKIRVYVDAATLVPSVYMSATPMDACEIFSVSYGNLPIDQWRVKEAHNG